MSGERPPAAPAQPSAGTAPVADRRTKLRAWWRGLSMRERQLLQAAALLLSVAVLWLLLLAPAWRTLQRAPAERARLESQLAEMRGLAEEAAQLRAAPAVSAEQAEAALKLSAERLGGRAKLSALQPERAVITLDGITLQDLGPWLQELRAGSRTRPVELKLTRSANGYSGSLVLSRETKP